MLQSFCFYHRVKRPKQYQKKLMTADLDAPVQRYQQLNFEFSKRFISSSTNPILFIFSSLDLLFNFLQDLVKWKFIDHYIKNFEVKIVIS